MTDTLSELHPRNVPPSAEEWLQSLPGPSVLRLAGAHTGAPRALSVLLHGNEPSGFRAVHRYLREGRRPARETLVFVGAVEAAKTAPLWSHRMLPGRRDLNRCFLELHEDVDGAVARDYLTVLERAQPEALVDLHNNTGHNPPYGVLVDDREQSVAICELFAPRGVLNSLRLGTLVEAWRSHCISVVLECGQAGAVEADEVAFRGLCRFLEAKVLPAAPSREMTLYRNTVRFMVPTGVELTFGDSASGDFTLRADLEHYNFRTVPAGTVLGWYGGDQLPLEARGADGSDQASDYLDVSDGQLLAKAAFVPIMMTTRPEVVSADCLCYLVTPAAARPQAL